MRGVKGFIAGTRSALLIAGLLLIPAGLVHGGTWVWPRGLWFAAVYGVNAIISSTAFALFRPAHFEARQQSVIATRQKRQPLIDAVGAGLLVAYWFGWLAFIPIDVFRLHLQPSPSTIVSALGGGCALVGMALVALAIWENQFATPNVQDQTMRGQQVIDTGVYGLLRHPIYAGNLLLFGGAALWLGSYAAFLGVAVMLVATLSRIAVEEKHLRTNLPGYIDYAKRVRGRLIPYVI